MQMTDRELSRIADLALRRTTISYPRWVANRAAGIYADNGAGTQWGKALEALALIGVSAPPPPLPPTPTPTAGGWGAKLPPPPLVLAAPPERIVNITPDASGWTAISGANDTIFRITPGTYGSTLYLDGDFDRCIFELAGFKSVGAHDGIKNTGALTDVIARGYEIAGVRSTGWQCDGPLTRVWRHGTIRDNNPNFAFGNRRNFHAYYDAPHGISRHVVTSGRVERQRNGYPFHCYSHYSAADGVFDSVIASMTLLECGEGGDDGELLDVGVGLWLVHGRRITIANTLALRCKRQLAAVASYADAGPISFVESAQVAQTGGDCSWGRDDRLAGTPLTTASAVGDNGYRVPADTRTSGIGAPTP